MFGKVASISFVVAMAALTGLSQAAAMSPHASDDLSPLSPAAHRDLDLPLVQPQIQQANALPNSSDTPTAPLPPALYPGLLLLGSLGGAKMVMYARRRIARG